MKENKLVRMEELPTRIDFSSNRVDDRMDLEGERQCHEDQVGWGLEEKRKRGERRKMWSRLLS